MGTDLYLLASVAEETLKKVQPHSVATALASIVLPVPGGPNSMTPCNAQMAQQQRKQLAVNGMQMALGGTGLAGCRLHVVLLCVVMPFATMASDPA